ncbi:hypothetical protein NE237_021566 [Protea cynaroides]|uniref:Uncharacterized protein n=1 Tax=Protea cynaroides TaxID=273540 RepID=A0A9Q0H818_9MAGN|nr:hypothetical protein NE237_021566 [Protea cynaroides]
MEKALLWVGGALRRWRYRELLSERAWERSNLDLSCRDNQSLSISSDYGVYLEGCEKVLAAVGLERSCSTSHRRWDGIVFRADLRQWNGVKAHEAGAERAMEEGDGRGQGSRGNEQVVAENGF